MNERRPGSERPEGRQSGRRKARIALLGIAETYVDAMMWKDELDQAGIPSMVRNGSATIGELQADLPFSPGQLEVYVPATALARSRQIVGKTVHAKLQPVETGSWPWVFAWGAVIGVAASFAVGIAVILGWR